MSSLTNTMTQFARKSLVSTLSAALLVMPAKWAAAESGELPTNGNPGQETTFKFHAFKDINEEPARMSDEQLAAVEGSFLAVVLWVAAAALIGALVYMANPAPPGNSNTAYGVRG